MLKRKREVFAPTDGVLGIMTETAARLARGVDFSGTTGLTQAYPLAFRQSRLRTEDMDLAEAEGVKVTRKVITRRSPDVDAGTVVAIDGSVYDVTRVDLFAQNMTLWLSELTTDGTCVLHGTTVTRDSHGEPTRADSPTTVYVRKASMGGESASKAGSQSVWPSIELTIRTVDWDQERSVTYRGVTYKVMALRGDGEWLVLTCEEGVAQHG